MSEPLFKVGELVGLVSVDFPHLNGQYHVRAIIYSGETYLDKFTGNTKWICTDLSPEAPAYLLDELDVAESDGTEYKWDESALRKIQKVSDYSFSELLTRLKQTSKIPSPAQMYHIHLQRAIQSF